MLLLTMEVVAKAGQTLKEIAVLISLYLHRLGETGLDSETFGRLQKRQLSGIDAQWQDPEASALRLGEDVLLHGYLPAFTQRRHMAEMHVIDFNGLLTSMTIPLRVGALLLTPKEGQ